jgi:hypothetical protein
MNENEIIALERIAIVSRGVLNVLDARPDLSSAIWNKLADSLRKEIVALDSIRKPPQTPAALDIIQQECDLYPQDSSLDILAVNIHKALLEAGYL